MRDAHFHDCGTPRHPFDRFAPVPDQGWLAKLIHRPDTSAATAVLERTLARLAPRVPSAGDVAGIYRHFRVSPRRARPLSVALWGRMLRHSRRNDVASADELRYLNALLVALDLRESDIAGVRDGENTFALLLASRERMFNSAAVTHRTSSPRHMVQTGR